MNIRKKIRRVARLLVLPKDWRAKGNMEFDFLLSLALFHKEIGQEEILVRFNYWYKEYCHLRIIITQLVVLLLGLLILSFTERNSSVTLCIVVAFVCMVLTFICLMQRRARAIDDKLLHCYYWIIAEVLRPNNNVEHKNIEDAFLKNLPAIEEQERKAEKKFRRFIRSFGYTTETINN